MTVEAIDTSIASRSNFSIMNGSRISLAILMNRHGTDKLYHHHYDGEYERHFGPIRDKSINILEIGIGGYGRPDHGGESLKVWRDYFPHATIVGIDIEEKNLDLGERITIRQCDQNDKATLWQLNEQNGPFDIIIDDGSHFQEHIFTSFNILWPFLNPGGIYVIEDLATAYWPEYGGDPEQPPAMRLLFHLCDQMHQAYWRILKPVDADSRVQSVHVSREIAFIYKQ